MVYHIERFYTFVAPLDLCFRLGYDEDGARELGNEIVETNKWIGTAGRARQ